MSWQAPDISSPDPHTNEHQLQQRGPVTGSGMKQNRALGQKSELTIPTPSNGGEFESPTQLRR